MYKSQRITVIIPCLNEEQGIEAVLRRMPEFVDQTIVVDNGSTDRTSDVARSFGAEVIREPVRGYGRSSAAHFVQTAFTHPRSYGYRKGAKQWRNAC